MVFMGRGFVRVDLMRRGDKYSEDLETGSLSRCKSFEVRVGC